MASPTHRQHLANSMIISMSAQPAYHQALLKLAALDGRGSIANLLECAVRDKAKACGFNLPHRLAPTHRTRYQDE